MNARLQQWLLVIRLLSCVAALAWGVLAQSYVTGLIGVLLLCWSWALVLLLRFLLLRGQVRSAVSGHAGVAELLAAWWQEVMASERVFSWRQPFASAAVPDHVPEQSSRRGVLLLHGFTCNRGLWNDWMRALRHREQPFMALSMEPAFGSIDAYADAIEAAVERLQSCSGGLAPVLVGHSMGGLAIRAWWRRYGRAGRVHRIITLGSPHAGTQLAHLSHTTNGKQMRRDSRWLHALLASETAEFHRTFDCIYSDCDQIVFPAETAVLPGSNALHLAGRGHLALVFAPESYACLMRQLEPDVGAAPSIIAAP